MKRLLQILTIVVSTATIFHLSALAQTPAALNETNNTHRHKPKNNGIFVGMAKIYDERTLQAQLAAVIRALSGAKFPDASGLFASVGQFQGANAAATSQALSLQTIPTPSISTVIGSGTNTTNNNTAGNTASTSNTTTSATPSTSTTVTVNTSGTPATPSTSTSVSTTSMPSGTTSITTGGTSNTGTSNTSVGNSSVNQTTNVPSVMGTIPQLPSQTSPFSFQPAFGLSAQDTLSGQTELEYQLVNLQMLLERSVTDRLYEVTDSDKQTKTLLYPRAQPVVGFQVSIDPSGVYKNAVAEVQITIATDVKSPSEKKPPFLVAMMPQSKTYNVASLRQSSSSLGLGIIANVFNLGFANNRSNQTLYLVKDIDTVGLERLPSDSDEPAKENSMRFAWQFRPVLGQDSVQPGSRQVFAVVGLPTRVNAPWLGTVSVKTFWRRLGKDKITTGTPIPGSCSEQPDALLLVQPAFERSLRLQSVQNTLLEDVGNGNVSVIVLGNFEAGTYVNLGNHTIATAQDGLLTSTSNRIKFVVSADELIRNVPILVDQYGSAVQVFEPKPVAAPTGLKWADKQPITVQRIDDSTSKVTLRITTVEGGPAYTAPVLGRYFNSPDAFQGTGTSDDVKVSIAETVNLSQPAHPHVPLIDIGGQVFGLSNTPTHVTVTGFTTVIEFNAPTALLTQSPAVTVQDLLWGNSFFLQENIIPPLTVTKVTNLGTNGDNVTTLAIAGTNLKGANVYAGAILGTSTDLGSFPNLLVVQFKKSALAPVKYLAVKLDDQSPAALIALEAPPAKVAPLTVTTTVPVMPIPLNVGDAVPVRFQGTGLDSITSISFGGVNLAFQPNKDNSKELIVSILPDLTKTAGSKVPILTFKDGTTLQDPKILSFLVR